MGPGSATARTRDQRLASARLGPTVRPALHYPLGDGGDPAAAGEALQRLYRHLKTA